MAGEPILIVDDTPVNLKLMRLVLTHEGYAVRTAERAEDAMQMLGSYRPDLILADLQLPGMDGLEMTRRIKRDPRTKAIKIVALTGVAGSGDLERAAGAGCDGYVSRPIETKALTARVREVLDRAAIVHTDHRLEQPVPQPVPQPGVVVELPPAGPQIDTRIDTRRDQFVNEAVAKPGPLPEIVEPGSSSNQSAPVPESAPEPVPDEVAAALRGKRMALIGFAPECAETICKALASVRALPRLFEATDGANCQPIQECDLVMIHVRRETLTCCWLDPASPPSGMQLVLAGDRHDLLNLPPAVRLRNVELVAAPWNAEELLMRLHMAVNRRAAAPQAQAPQVQAQVAEQSPAPAVGDALPAATAAMPEAPAAPNPQPSIQRPKVVLADDDTIVLTVVGSTLQNYGMLCEQVNNGKDALRLIRETQPQVAVLDVNMPGMDGYEVLAAIRAENLPVAVILLTARQREGDILRGFQMGADDYLTKPFNPLELMARMKRLLRR